MIKTPSTTMIGGAGIWTPGCTVISGQQNIDQLIKSLFAGGEDGFFCDPNDLSTMFQDAAGTVPVTGAGQPVGLIRDKSGRGNHASQTDSAMRPILRQNAITGAYYLEFDGSDDFLVTNSIDFTSTDKISVFAGVRKSSDAAAGSLVELSVSTAGKNGSFHLRAPTNGGVPDYEWCSKGTVRALVVSPLAYASPISNVISATGNISRDSAILRVNGVQVTSTTSDQGTGNFENHPLYIGRRGGTQNPFNGHIYGLIGIGRLTTESETETIEKELAKRTGVTLSV